MVNITSHVHSQAKPNAHAEFGTAAVCIRFCPMSPNLGFVGSLNSSLLYIPVRCKFDHQRRRPCAGCTKLRPWSTQRPRCTSSWGPSTRSWGRSVPLPNSNLVRDIRMSPQRNGRAWCCCCCCRCLGSMRASCFCCVFAWPGLIESVLSCCRCSVPLCVCERAWLVVRYPPMLTFDRRSVASASVLKDEPGCDLLVC